MTHVCPAERDPRSRRAGSLDADYSSNSSPDGDELRLSLLALCGFEEQRDDGDDPALPVRYRSGADGKSNMAAVTSHPGNLFAVHRLAFERAGHWPFLGLEGLAIGMKSLKMRILGHVGCRIERLSQDSSQILTDAKELAGRRLCNRQSTRHLLDYLLKQGQLALNVLL